MLKGSFGGRPGVCSMFRIGPGGKAGICRFVILLTFLAPLPAREFSVMAYNVNNLFDVDGLSMFNDYKQTGNKTYAYSPRKLLTKIQNIAKVLKTVNHGKGPDVILFQEFEYDFTPDSTISSYDAFLKEYADMSVEDMLTSSLNDTITGLPVEALALKYFSDTGLEGYRIAMVTDRTDLENAPPHVNVVFSRLPIVDVKYHPVLSAREIVEVRIDVEGHLLILFDNHWKSNRGGVEMTEVTRLQNASVLRNRIDRILSENPNADIIVGGDLNCQYNQTQVHQSIHKSGINEILKSRGDEVKMLGAAQGCLYNLWYEMPRKERFSDSYDDTFGTLMHIILSQGLYDYKGIQYVDGSFEVVRIPGFNAEKRWLVPIASWISGETGGGYSDHFPVIARFRTVDDDDTARFLKLESPGKESPEDAQHLRVGYESLKLDKILDARILKDMGLEELSKHYDELFHVTAMYDKGTESLSIGPNKFKLYSRNRKVKAMIKSLPDKQEITIIGMLVEYKGTLEFIINHPSWIK